MKPAADWLKCFNWNGQTEDQILHQIKAIQHDALLEAAEIARKEGEGAPDEIYEVACRNIHDGIIERIKTLTPYFHSTSGGKNE